MTQMPAKKTAKARKVAKTATRKATAKAAAPKKTTRPPAKPTVKAGAAKPAPKPKKPVTKAIAKPKAPEKKASDGKSRAKPAPAAKPTPGPATAAVTAKPPLAIGAVRQLFADEETDFESQPSSLLAGPRNVKPYIPRRGEQYMSKEQLEHFAQILQNWKRDLMEEVDRTVLHMKDEAANFPDPNDRATQEEEFSLELRTRDRERKLIRKIDEALKRIEEGTYGYCLETGEEIGIKRLEARPVATLSVEAQERRERREKQYGDRDDRYR
jgi:DnaK suppressor protein